jgi:hypothetical protein
MTHIVKICHIGGSSVAITSLRTAFLFAFIFSIFSIQTSAHAANCQQACLTWGSSNNAPNGEDYVPKNYKGGFTKGKIPKDRAEDYLSASGYLDADEHKTNCKCTYYTRKFGFDSSVHKTQICVDDRGYKIDSKSGCFR